MFIDEKYDFKIGHDCWHVHTFSRKNQTYARMKNAATGEIIEWLAPIESHLDLIQRVTNAAICSLPENSKIPKRLGW